MTPTLRTSVALAVRACTLAVLVLAPAVLVFAAERALAAAITGVCPDGSIFIVQSRANIPCRAAKEVAPEEVPPVRPEYLPQPYTWQIYRDGANPNNPYNLVDQARQLRQLYGAPGQPAPPSPYGTAPQHAAPHANPHGQPQASPYGQAQPPRQPYGQPMAPRSYAARRPPPVELALSDGELRDLFFIVELSQQHAPARIVKEDVHGDVQLEIAFAHSGAFEERFDRATRAAPHAGPVLLWSVVAHGEGRFDPNFTFIQDHESFRPRADDPHQMGILFGTPGDLTAEDVVLGYVTLPPGIDLGQEVHVYWNDRRVETVLAP